ncbi:APC family permease [Granulicella sibirica]|uniref:Amino acid permease-associated region n=1 Tax=Granulicella sibirica TaxID=2479048 RepID=A0A4Q0SYY3_9BACT|nr:amino acid permease [Granulicella sibirica]RXH54266.1 amino acid permease-associated region [Granulicella sibirica]
MAEQERELPRVLNAAHATSIVVGIIIGSGIFLVPREMMAAVGGSGMVYAVWIVGGLLSLFGAMTYAEIAAAKPMYGGEYAFLREAYGDVVAFLYMWTWITIAKPASIATIAAGLMRVLGTFAMFSFLGMPAFGPLMWSQVFAIGATWLITGLNIIGTRKSGNVQLLLTWLKGLLIVVIAGFCFLTAGGHGSWSNFGTTFAGARGGFSGFMVALIAALWAYDGWSDVTQMAGEVQRPQRSLPVALIGGVGIVGGLYMLTNAAIQYVLPAAAIAGAERPAADAMRLVAGGAGAALVSIGMAVSIGATFVGSSLSGARVPFAAARDGLFFEGLAHVSPRFRTPSSALILQAVLSSLLLLAIGRFQALFSLAIFAEWMFYALTASTIFVFRRRDAAGARPFSVWGYPVVPVLFIAAAGVLLVFSIMDQPRNSLFGMAVILLGIPVHALYQRGRRAAG